MKGAWKVGVVVVAFGVLFFGIYAFLNRSIFAKKTSIYFAEFADAGGITVGSGVLMAGVNIGQVSDVKLVSASKAKITLEIQSDIQIPEGSTVELPTSFISFGDRQLTVNPPKTMTGARIQPGSTLAGIKSSPLDSMIPNSNEAIAELTKTLKSTRALLEDKQLKGRVDELLKSTAETTKQFGLLARRVDGMLASNQGVLQRAMINANKVISDLSVVSTEIAKLVKDGKLSASADKLLAQMDHLLASGDKLVASMDAMVNDPNLRGGLNKIVANTEKMTEHGVKITENAEKMTEEGVKIAENATTLTESGISIAQKVDDLGDKANEIATKASDLADKAGTLLDSFNQTVGGLGKGGVKAPKIDVSMDLFRETDPNRWRTEFSAKTQLGGHDVYLGVYDAFESNKLNLQAGWKPMPDLNIRYGIYASKPGVGVDYAFARGIGLRGDVFDLNKPRFDMRARFELGSQWVGWVGLERIFDRNAPSLGLGIRF